jgi:ubiquinol-cytochrome c reductase iron-sulfur subunit
MRFFRWLIGLVVAFKTVRGVRDAERPRPDRIVAPTEPAPRAELVVAGLLLACAAASALFVVAYALGWSTQALGGTLAAALLALAAAFVVLGQRLVSDQEIVEDYPADEHPDEQAEVAQIVRESGEGITRKRLLGGAAAIAGGTLGAALVTPAVSLGPVFDTSRLNETPWRPGRRLVDEQGRPIEADAIEAGPFYTAFAEGADRKQLGSSLVVVRLDPAALRLPAARAGWAPEGILAYSKICPHAGCAIALYRNPKFDPTQPRPALICPCHYSTFDPADGGTVLFGPAGRPLPQLPLEIGADRTLRAAGDLSTPAGPSWWGIRDA